VFICTSRRTKTETADFVTAALRFETAVASLLRCPGIDHVHSLFVTDWRCFCTYWLWGFFFRGFTKALFDYAHTLRPYNISLLPLHVLCTQNKSPFFSLLLSAVIHHTVSVHRQGGIWILLDFVRACGYFFFCFRL